MEPGGVGGMAESGWSGTLADDRPDTSLAMRGSRALVVGTGSHVSSSVLPGIPAVAGTVSAVSRALVDRCGLSQDHVSALTDPADPKALLTALTETASQAEDVLLFYYVGHGLVSLGGELYLATRDTRDQDISLAVEALSYATVREALTTCRARAIIVVLDCCFSGRAYGAFGTAVADAFELTYVRGSFLLSAASATEQALAPEGAAYTAFSGALLDFLREGDPAAPRYLTFEDAYRYLSRVLPQGGFPAPHRRAGDQASDLVLAVNPAARPVIRKRSALPGSGAESRPEAGRNCPYRGLSAFTANDTRYFFGRERMVTGALATVAERAATGPIALVGRSGSGKSSLLRAGLLPAIKAGRLGLPGSRDWPQIVMTPGEHPLHALASRLARSAGLTQEAIRTRLAADPRQLADIALGSNGQDAATGLVLCVDQFEELFTACSDEAGRRAFIRALCGCGQAARIVVILGVRADFYGHCLAYPELGPTLERGQIPVQPMTAGELRAAIEGPADAAGLVLEDGLADRLLQDLYVGQDTAHDAGSALPLLSYALQSTWQQSDGQTLTLADYQATGGIWRAVTLAADRTYDALGVSAKEAARLLLLSMVRLGDGTDDVRRRIGLADLRAGRPDAEQAAIAAARDAFVAARLITVADDAAEIAHEALLRAWPRLRTWINEDRSELLARQRLADAARTWDAEGGEVGLLYSGARLELASHWLDDTDTTGRGRRSWRRPAGERQDGSSSQGSLSPLERGFLAASIRTARARRRRRRTVPVIGIVVLVALALTGVYARQQQVSDRDSQAVQSSVYLAAEADSLRASDPAGAMWLSLAAYNTAATQQARSSLYESLTTPYPVPLPGDFSGPVNGVAYSPDGRTVAGSGADGTIRLWQVTDPLHPALLAELHVSSSGSGVAFSPDGGVLAVHTEQALQLWDVRDPARPVLLSSVHGAADVAVPGGELVPVAFSPDGATVAIGNAGGRFRLWDVANPRHPVLDASLAADRQAVYSVAFSPDGQTLATASATASQGPGGGRVRLWDVRAPRAPALRGTLAVNSALVVAFSPVGHTLIAAGVDDSVQAWNVADPGHPVKVSALDTQAGLGNDPIDSIAFRPDGQAFVTTYTGGQTDVWSADPAAGGLESNGSLPDPAGPVSAAFSPSGQELVTGDESGSAELWVMLTPLLPGSIDADSPGSAFGYGGTSKDKLLAVNAPTDSSGRPTGPATLWDVSDPLRPVLAASLPPPWVSATFPADGRTLLTKSRDDALRLWDTANPHHPVAGATLTDSNPDGAISPAVSPDGQLLAVATGSGSTVQVWNVRNFRHPFLDASIALGEPAQSIWFLDDHLIGSVGSQQMQLWDLTNPGHPVSDAAIPPGVDQVPINVVHADMTYVPSGKLLTTVAVAGASQSESSLWNLANPRDPRLMAGELDADPNAVTWISSQVLGGAMSNDDVIALWSAGTAPRLLTAYPIGSQHQVNSIVSSPDSAWLAAGLSDTGDDSGDEVTLWNVPGNDRSLAEFAELPGDSRNVVFARDSDTLASNLSAITAGQLAAFTPDNTPAVLYPLDAGSVYNRLCAMTRSTLDGRSRPQYLPATFYRLGC
jgi:WD40 repeat protein